MSAVSQVMLFLITIFFELYAWAIIIRIVLQWQREDYHNPLSRLVITLTRWPLAFFYKLLPYRKGLDWAAVVFLALVTLIKVALLFVVLHLPMHPVNLLLFALIDLIRQTLNLYFYILLIVVVTSWLASGYVNPMLGALNRMIKPLLSPIRRVLPPIGGFDFSPLVLLIIVKVVDILLLHFVIF